MQELKPTKYYKDNIFIAEHDTGNVLMDGVSTDMLHTLATEMQKASRYTGKPIPDYLLPYLTPVVKKHEDQFIFLRVSNDAIEQAFKISRSNLARLAMLAMDLGRSGRATQVRAGYGFKPKRIMSLLMMNEKSYYPFVKEMKEAKMLFTDSYRTIHMNTDIFLRGKIDRSTEEVYIRIFKEAYRSLYECTPFKKHYLIGYVLLTSYYLNVLWNMLVGNQDERRFKNLNPLPASKFRDIIQLSESNTYRVLNSMKELEFSVRGIRQKVFMQIDGAFFINPNLIYCGRDKQDVAELTSMFYIDQPNEPLVEEADNPVNQSHGGDFDE